MQALLGGNAGRLFASRRRPQSDRDLGAAAEARSGLDARRWPRRRCRPTRCRATATVVELGEVVRVTKEAGSPMIFRRDGRFADMVMAELAGAYEAPIYGMLEVAKRIDAHDWGALPKPVIHFHGQPKDEAKPTLLWDGEWEITYVTFRDMGAAFVRRHSRHLRPGRRAVRQLQAAARDPDADSADADRHRARPLAVRRAVHRDLDDRLHRARRHHRAQLDPAGRFHPPRREARARRCATSCSKPARCASSRSC